MAANTKVPAPETWVCARDYQEFFRGINLLSAGLQAVETRIRSGEWSQAFREYRTALFGRLGRLSLSPLDPAAKDPVAAADNLLANRISLLGTGLVDIGSPIDWLITPGGDKQWQSHLGYFYFASCLVAAYRKSGNRAYLDKWTSVLTDFFAFHPVGVPGLTWSRTQPMYRNELAYGCGGEGRFPDYAGGSWLGLSCGRVLLWLSSLEELGDDPFLPDAFLANLLTSIMRDHATVMLNNPRRYTPNQFLHVSVVLASLGVILPEYNVSPACYLVGMDRLETSMRTSVLADGSDMEQSFNYNSGLPGRFNEIHRLYEGSPTPRVAALREVIARRCRFLAAVATPLGTWPALGKTHGDDVRPLLSEWAKLFALPDIGRGALAARGGAGAAATAPVESLGAGSIAFPFGGYYVLRGGLGPRDPYLLLKASRIAIGHMHEDTNSIVLFAHGRQLLADSGNYNYADDAESWRRNRYFFSSMAHNTVTVDALSQGRLVLQGSADLSRLKEPIAARWYDSPTLGLAEGFYGEGYTAPTSHPPADQERRLPGSHERRVLWIKPDVWVVVDVLEVGSAGDGAKHQFTAHWQLPPELAPELIAVDAAVPLVRTTDPSGANVTIACSRPCTPVIVRGSMDPYAGWTAVHYNEASPSADVAFGWNGGGRTCAVHLVVAQPGPASPVVTFEALGDGLRAKLVDGRTLAVLTAGAGPHVSTPSPRDGKPMEGSLIVTVGDDEVLVLDCSAACASLLGVPGARDVHVRGGEACRVS